MPLPTPHPVLNAASMNAVDEKSDQVYGQFNEMCYDLNMDKMTAREAWNSYCQVKQNYSLEGNKLHWLACSLYVSCRKHSVPSVGGLQAAPMQGNFISLTRLLRFSKFSLLEFFDKSKKWAEMCNLPQPFQRNLDALERNFAVSTFLFNNYFEPMFKNIYTDPADDPPRPPKSRKQRRGACTASEVFEFTWTLFVLVKSTIPSVSSDLVSTYHLLLACVDFMFGVTVAADRRDLLNRECPALPDNFNSRDYEPPTEVASILEYLCNQFDGLIIEAKAIRQHVWKDKIGQLFVNKALHGETSTQHGILDQDTFEMNWKSVNKRYEEYLLTCGNFDERSFLGERAGQEIGTPSKANNYSVTAGDLAERIHVRRNLMLTQGTQNKSVLMPATPLTGRSYLKAESALANPAATPITASMYSVSRLQALLEGRGPQPSAQLATILSSCSPDPTETIAGLVSEFRTEFSAACTRTMAEEEAKDLVERRFSMAAAFFYKILESVVTSERQKKPNINLLVLLDQAVFHRCLLACSLEIVLFSYSTAPLEFPWLLDSLNIEPYDFYKLLEIIIREEQGLCRDVVKHLNKVEELVLDSMAWRRCSRLWTVIEAASGNIPTSETVAPHLQDPSSERTSSLGSGPTSVLMSPAQNPAVRRVYVTYSSRPSPLRNPHQSPLSSATDRFMSPVAPSSARRRLFVGPRAGGGQHRVISEAGRLPSSAVRTYSLFVGSRLGEGRTAAPISDGERTVTPSGLASVSAAAAVNNAIMAASPAGNTAATTAGTGAAITAATAASTAGSTDATAATAEGTVATTTAATSADAAANVKTETSTASSVAMDTSSADSVVSITSAAVAASAAAAVSTAADSAGGAVTVLAPSGATTATTAVTFTAAGLMSAPAAAQTPSRLAAPAPAPAAAAAAAGQTATPGGDTPGAKPQKQNSLGLFFRKFYYLASVRMRDLCERLKLMDDVRETIWTVFEFVIVNHVTVMQGRHLDQLIMSAIFVVCKAFGINKKFTDIMGMYRCQPQAKSHVYRSVLLGVNQKAADGSELRVPPPPPQPETPAGKSVKATPGGVTCPPTPSRMAGTATSYEFEDRNEERGDIIQFYNQVFVEKVKAFVSKFSKGDGKPPLSPLPSPRLSPLPRSRKVSSMHSIYISPLKQSPGRFADRAGTIRSYSFNRSPAHELRSINAMVKPVAGTRSPAAAARLRAVLQPADADEPEPKRYKARLRDVLDQRQANVTE